MSHVLVYMYRDCREKLGVGGWSLQATRSTKPSIHTFVFKNGKVCWLIYFHLV